MPMMMVAAAQMPNQRVMPERPAAHIQLGGQTMLVDKHNDLSYRVLDYKKEAGE